MKTAVIYARFSCASQREASIEDQLKECHRWCDDNGYVVVAEYCDYAISGRTDERPQFQEMILNAGESEVAVVYMMDRFSRDVYDATVYKKKLRDKGVTVVSATQQLPDGPEARLIESIYEAMAEMESVNIARRVRRGMTGNAEKCMHNGVKVFGYDWTDDGHFAVNDAEAEMVREVFDRRIAGESMNSIARDLANRGVRTRSDKPCRQQMIQEMIHNEKYIGIYQWGEVRVEHGMPAIIDEDTFLRAQNVRGKKMRKGEHWHDFAFAGKMVCIGCGANMVGVTGTGRHGIRYHYYRCGKECGVTNIRADMLEAEVADRLRSMLESRGTALEIAKTVSMAVTDETAAKRIEVARKSLDEAKRGIANIMRAVEAGMDYADVADRLAELKAQRVRAESNIRTWTKRSTIDVDDFADFLQHGFELTDRALLDAFVWQVQANDEKVIVVLSYGKPTRLEIPRRFAEEWSGTPNTLLCEPLCGVCISYYGGFLVLSFKRKKGPSRRRGDIIDGSLTKESA